MRTLMILATLMTGSFLAQAKTQQINLALSDKQTLTIPTPQLIGLTSKFHKDLKCSPQAFKVTNEYERAVECKLQDGVAGQVFVKQLKDSADGAPLMDIQFLNPEATESSVKRNSFAWGEVIEWAETNNGGSTYYYLRSKQDSNWYVLRLSNSLAVPPATMKVKSR